MATVSIRSTALHCLGKTGTISVYRDVFGYIFGRIDRDLRVREHLERIKGPSINLVTFLVGYEDESDSFWTESRLLRVQHAIDLTREIYAQADMGVRSIFWRSIAPPESDPFIAVDAGQATDLTEAYSGPEDGIDVFWVVSVIDADGWSNSEGPCDKDDNGRTGAVLQIANLSDDGAGVLLAHEVGHYLRLEHANSINNVMGHDRDGNGIGKTDAALSRNLNSRQADLMHDSCWTRGPC